MAISRILQIGGWVDFADYYYYYFLINGRQYFLHPPRSIGIKIDRIRTILYLQFICIFSNSLPVVLEQDDRGGGGGGCRRQKNGMAAASIIDCVFCRRKILYRHVWTEAREEGRKRGYFIRRTESPFWSLLVIFRFPLANNKFIENNQGPFFLSSCSTRPVCRHK